MAAYEDPGKVISLPAAGDLSAKQFRAVIVESDGQCNGAGDGVPCVGILQNKPDAEFRMASVMVNGVSKAVAGTGGVTAGDDVASEADSDLVSAAANEYVVGMALQTAAAGETFALLINTPGRVTA